MLLPRRFAAAATAFLLVAGAFFILLFSAVDLSAEAASGTCGDVIELAVSPWPLAPWKGVPLRVMVVTEKPIGGTLSLISPDGGVAAKSTDRHGGPPYSWLVEVAAPAAGTWHVTLTRDHAPAECSTITRDIAVNARKPAPPHTSSESLWQVRNSWNRETENLFSAWIERLFDAPLDQQLSWKAWHDVLRDRSRNFLFNYFGLGEDNVAMGLRPDCADFVYFLRAYFAFKMGLPFGYSNCTSGLTSSILRSRVPPRRPNRTLHRSPPRPSSLPPRRQLPPFWGYLPGPSPSRSGRQRIRLRRSRSTWGLQRRSANICGPSATSFILDPCACRRAKTTPIFTPHR
jgi:hypothetical protein